MNTKTLRFLAAFAFSICLGTVAEAQPYIGIGDFGITPATGEVVKGTTSPKFIEATLLTDSYDLGSTGGAFLAGWWTKESSDTIGDCTATTPGVNLDINPATGQRAGWTEAGIKYGTLNLTHDEQQNYRFSITDFSMGTDLDSSGVIYFSIGDSSFTTVDRTPDGFGVIVVGTEEEFGGIDAGQWVAFVGDGSDTTYVPMGSALATKNRFEIYAAADGGPVTFYLNNALVATISEPARSSNEDIEGISFWIQNDDSFNGVLHMGPIWYQREWD